MNLDKELASQGDLASPSFLEQDIATVNEQPTQSNLSTIEKKLTLIRQQAHEHLEAKRWPQAGEAFLQLLDHNMQDEDALLGVAKALDGINRFESLYSAAQCILDIQPNSAQGLAYKARALQKMERLSEATIANDQALLLDTNLGLAWINRSGLQLLQQKFHEALRSAERAIKLAPDDARAWANKGVALLNFNRLAEALEAFDNSLKIDPGQSLALQMKGEILCRLGRMREAIPVIRQALIVNPNDVTVLTQGIQALRALEMYAPLIELAKELIKIDPNNLLAWDNYMRGLRGLGLFTEVSPVLDHLLEMDTTNIRYWTLKADTLYRLQQYREAANTAERALRIAPDYAPAHRIHDKALKLMYQKGGRKKRQKE